MNYILINKQIKKNKKKKNWESLISTYIWIAFLMISPLTSPYFMIISFGIQLYRLLRYSLNIALLDIVFTMPFVSVYKAPNGDILLVYYVLLFNIIFLIKKKVLIYNSTLIIMFTSFIYFISRIGEKYTTPIFICGGMLFLYLTLTNKFNLKFEKMMKLFCLSTVISSIYALITINIFNISYTNIDLKGRFSGVFIDPNYYSIFLILSLIGLIDLKSSNKIRNIEFYLEFVSLTFFGALTGSKSFLLLFLLVILFQVAELISKRKFFQIFFWMVSICFLVIYIEQKNISVFDLVLKRLNSAKNVNELTTGRFNIWVRYIDYIFSDLKVIIFGEGLDKILNKGTHNIILEIIYNCGIVGLFFLILFFKSLFSNSKKYYLQHKKISILCYFPIFSLLVSYFFLQGIATLEFYLLVFISFVCFYLGAKNLKN